MPIVLKVTSAHGRPIDVTTEIPPDAKYSSTVVGKKPDGKLRVCPSDERAKLAQRYVELQRPDDERQPWQLNIVDDGLHTEIRIGDVLLMETTTQATVNLGETINIKDVVTFQILQAQRRSQAAPSNTAETT